MLCLCLEDQWKYIAMERETEEEQAVLLSTQFCSQLILQNILVSVEVNRKKWTVMAYIETGSYRLHILKKRTLEMGYNPSSLRG